MHTVQNPIQTNTGYNLEKQAVSPLSPLSLLAAILCLSCGLFAVFSFPGMDLRRFLPSFWPPFGLWLLFQCVCNSIQIVLLPQSEKTAKWLTLLEFLFLTFLFLRYVKGFCPDIPTGAIAFILIILLMAVAALGVLKWMPQRFEWDKNEFARLSNQAFNQLDPSALAAVLLGNKKALWRKYRFWRCYYNIRRLLQFVFVVMAFYLTLSAIASLSTEIALFYFYTEFYWFALSMLLYLFVLLVIANTAGNFCADMVYLLLAKAYYTKKINYKNYAISLILIPLCFFVFAYFAPPVFYGACLGAGSALVILLMVRFLYEMCYERYFCLEERKTFARNAKALSILEEQCDPRAFIQDIEELLALQFSKDNRNLGCCLAVGYHEDGRYDKSIPLMEFVYKAGAPDSQSYALYVAHMGRMYWDTGQKEAFYRILSGVDPAEPGQDIFSLLFQGQAFQTVYPELNALKAMWNGDYMACMGYFSQRFSLNNPQQIRANVYCRYIMALAYEEMGDAQKAKECFQYAANHGGALYIAKLADKKLRQKD